MVNWLEGGWVRGLVGKRVGKRGWGWCKRVGGWVREGGCVGGYMA